MGLLGWFAIILHTSKRMHFIEDNLRQHLPASPIHLHTSKRMHFIEECGTSWRPVHHTRACIRQNVCTSLRI